MKETIGAVVISLKIGDSTALFILLSADGAVNRSGTGAITNSEHDLFIGRTQVTLFEQFMAGVDESIFAYTGRYVYPEPKGQLCTLNLTFQVPPDVNGRDSVRFEFIYGSESEGPNSQIGQIVRSAVRLTNPWYERQKQMVAKSQKGTSPTTPITKVSELLRRLFWPR